MGLMLSSMYLELLKPLWSQQSLRSCCWQGGSCRDVVN